MSVFKSNIEEEYLFEFQIEVITSILIAPHALFRDDHLEIIVLEVESHSVIVYEGGVDHAGRVVEEHLLIRRIY
jgi:hypothetical protein